jgi:hypothetical protein
MLGCCPKYWRELRVCLYLHLLVSQTWN